MVLFFLFIGGFSKKDLKIHPSIIKNQVSVDNHAVNALAISADCSHSQKILSSFDDYDKQLFISRISSVRVLNKQISFETSFQSKREDLIKAIILQELFYKCKLLDDEIPSILS